jgi:Kef-type K+ transport system membrane component KefB
MSEEKKRKRLFAIVVANFAFIVWYLLGAQPWLLFPLFGILFLGTWLTLRKAA